MRKRACVIPTKPKIETERVPIEWLHDIALREGNSKKPIYHIHKWWARRQGSIFRTLLILSMIPSSKRIDHVAENFYSRHAFSDLTVLDPFMGGGTSIVEASKCGARTIGIDIDPVAWFTTKKEIEPCPVKQIHSAFADIEQSIGSEIQSYYQTRTPEGQVVPVIYYFWVDLITCPHCGTQFEAHPHYQLFRDRKNAQQTVFCKTCHEIESIPLSETSFTCRKCGDVTEVKKGTVSHGTFTCPQCHYSAAASSLARGDGPLSKRLFVLEYEFEDEEGKVSRSYKTVDAYDKRVFKRAERRFEELKAELPFPRDEIPAKGRSDQRPLCHGYKHYHQLFNARQLLCLSLLYREIVAIRDNQVREYLMITFSNCLSKNNMLCSYAFDYRRLSPLFSVHAFNVINRPVENNIWGSTKRFGRGSFSNCVKQMLRGKDYAERCYEINYEGSKPKRVVTGEKATASVTADVREWYRGKAQSLLLNRSSTNLQDLRDGSVDLVLTDPPYYNNLSYSELSDFFYVWLRDHLPCNGKDTRSSHTPFERALYVSSNDGSSRLRFVRGLTEVFAECDRLLRSDGLMVLTYHHRKLDAWDGLARALYDAGFIVTNVFPVRSEGKSGFHSTAGTIKWDAVLVCRSAKGDVLEKACGTRGFLRSVMARHSKWERRLQQANLPYGWADSLSLGYAISVQQAILRARFSRDVSLLLGRAARYLTEAVAQSPGHRGQILNCHIF